MKRHWHCHIRVAQHTRPCDGHQPSKRPSERSMTVVFQGVNDRSQCAVVFTDGAGTRNQMLTVVTSWTYVELDAHGSPRLPRITTDVAQRRRERFDLLPARLTDRSAGWFVERVIACRADWRENYGEERIDDLPTKGGSHNVLHLVPAASAFRRKS